MGSSIDRREFLIAGGAVAGLTAIAPGHLEATSKRVWVVGLRSDYQENPLILENPNPRLSWRLESVERNVQQSAYRVLVATSAEGLEAGEGDLWDSGKVESRRSIGIRYQGRSLTSRQRCWWNVRIWDERGCALVPSASSWWEMGLLEPQEWVAQWLAAEDPITKGDREAGLHWIWGDPVRETGIRRFRCKFTLPTTAGAAWLYAATNDWSWWAQVICIWIDGEPLAGLGEWTDRSAIAPTDVPGSLGNWLVLNPMRAGEHLIAIEVATRALGADVSDAPLVRGIASLIRVMLDSGEILRLGTGENWNTSTGNEPDWYAPGYDDISWQKARRATIENYQPWPPQPAMDFRAEFSVEKSIAKARLYATALGVYEARLNGARVGDAFLTPEVSRYDKRVLYQGYDVSSMVRIGRNTLGVSVGDGWYANFDGRFPWGPPPRRLLAQLELTFADGSRKVVATGPGWRLAEGPIRASEIRSGEIYDARCEHPGWDAPMFDDSGWREAEVAELPSCRLAAQASPPIRATQTLRALTVARLRRGVYLFDFGQNFAGWSRLHVRGARGTRVELRFAELLASSGEVIQPYFNIGEPKRDVFVLGGDPAGETFEPHFTYRGFRYVQVSGLDTPPTVRSLEGIVVHSDLEVTGKFRTNVPEIERLWRNTVWSQRSNFVGIATDCPSREQRGWTGDAGVFWDAAAFNMDVCTFTSRQMDNVIDDQSQDGAFPIVAPTPRNNNSLFHVTGTAPGWGDAGILLPWTAWRRYRDVGIIERSWNAMNRYMQFIQDLNPDYLWRKGRGYDYGDLYENPLQSGRETPKDLVSTAYWAHSADLLAQMAEVIGRKQDAARLRTVFDRVRRAFGELFVTPEGAVGNGSQTGYVLALQFGLIPTEKREAAAQQLAADIRRRGVALTTGYLGTQFILDVLVEAGSSDLAYGLLLRGAFPSWGYMIRNGATTIWETWSDKEEFDDRVYKISQNHYALGSVSGFLFRRLAGIDAATPGFETILIRPTPDPRVTAGGGDYDSIMGRISTDWSLASDGSLRLDVTIPANTSAHVYLPARRNRSVEERGEEIWTRDDIRIVARRDLEVVLEVGSGTYHFRVAG